VRIIFLPTGDLKGPRGGDIDPLSFGSLRLRACGARDFRPLSAFFRCYRVEQLGGSPLGSDVFRARLEMCFCAAGFMRYIYISCLQTFVTMIVHVRAVSSSLQVR
jgi:hypothetical protein